MRTTILAALLLCLAGCSHQPEGCRCTPTTAPGVKVDIHLGKDELKIDTILVKPPRSGKGVESSGCSCWRDCTCKPGQCQCKADSKCSTSCNCQGK